MRFRKDPKGYYLIEIKNNKIHAGLFSNKRMLLNEYYESDAETLYKKIIMNKGITYPEHAAYLGFELHKAEIAIRLNIKYVQDKKLNF